MRNFLLIVAMVAFMSACENPFKKASPTPTPAMPDVVTSGEQAFEKTKPNEIPFKLYRLSAMNPVNLNISPLSLKMAFAMIYPGTEDQKKSTLEQLFGFKEGDKDLFKAEWSVMEDVSKKNSKEHGLAIANSLWIKNKDDVKSYFLNAVKPLRAEVKPLALKPMNDWVNKSTRGKIQKIIDKIEANTFLIAINAIYFKAPWQTPFKKENNVWGAFQSSPHATKNLEMMRQTHRFRYYEDDHSQWIELPYEDSAFVMIAALPKKRFDLRAIEDQLGSDYLKKVHDGFESELVDLAFPKFKFSQKESLKRLLVDAGFNELFEKGGFKKISSSKELVISDIIQATAVDVNEVGTEAAAATATVMEATSAPISLGMKKKFYADQPFFFLIENKKTQEIYFMGRVYQP